MPVLYPSRMIADFKIVYYGPGLAGKTTNIQYIHDKTDPRARGKLISVATETDRILSSDFSPPGPDRWRDFSPRLRLYTVPGPVFYDRSRLMILNGADGAIFVADSQEARMDANIQSMEELESFLAVQATDLSTLPFVIQYNKRDLPTAVPVAVLDAAINPAGRPRFEAIAWKGQGVFATLDAVWKQVLTRHGAEQLNAGEPGDIRWEEPPPPAGGGEPRPSAKDSWWQRMMDRVRGR